MILLEEGVLDDALNVLVLAADDGDVAMEDAEILILGVFPLACFNYFTEKRILVDALKFLVLVADNDATMQNAGGSHHGTLVVNLPVFFVHSVSWQNRSPEPVKRLSF